MAERRMMILGKYILVMNDLLMSKLVLTRLTAEKKQFQNMSPLNAKRT
jgi:hypothetical protein